MAFIPKGEHMLRKLREARDEEGFTLIELLVVVLIIGILAAIAIPVFLNQREKAFADAVQSDLRNLAVVMEDYYSDNDGVYPTAVPADFDSSDGVTDLAIVAGTTDGYCLEATHTALDEAWEYDARDGAVTAQVQEVASLAAACA